MISVKSFSAITGRIFIILLNLVLTIPSMNGQGRTGNGIPVVSGETISPQASGIKLELLFDGIADLYYYGDKETEHFLIVQQNGQVFTIYVPKQIRRPDAEDGPSAYAACTSVILLAMADAPELEEKIRNITLDRESLVSLMHDYHEYLAGSDAGISYEVRPHALEVRVGIYSGYRSEVYKVNPGGERDGLTMDPAFYPAIGLSLTSPLPRITRNLSLALDIQAAKRYVYGYYIEDILDPEKTTFEELHLHSVIMQVDLLAGYSFGAGRMIPFLCAGVTGQGIIKDDSRLDSDTVEEDIVISQSEPFSLEKKFRPGILLGAGLTYNLFLSQALFLRLDYSYLFGDSMFSSVRSAGISAGIIF